MTSDTNVVPEDENTDTVIDDDGLTNEPEIEPEPDDTEDDESRSIVITTSREEIEGALAIALEAVRGALEQAGLDVDVEIEEDLDENEAHPDATYDVPVARAEDEDDAEEEEDAPPPAGAAGGATPVSGVPAGSQSVTDDDGEA